MRIPLYKIKQEYDSAINDFILQDNDIDYQSICDTLSAIQDEFKEKAINISSAIKNIEYEINAMKDYENKMKERRDRLQNKRDNIIKYLKYNLIESGIQKINGSEFDIVICKSKATVKIENEKEVPEEYRIKKESIIINKTKLREDLLSGKQFDFANLHYGFYLKIK